tara:strand:+ start:102 stop:482 length:381 start_codon:yes stop_codon:yes gene_type:complete
MFGNLIKKLVPVAIGAAAAYTGASMFGGNKLWASSTLTNKFKEKIGKEALKEGFKSIFATPDQPSTQYSDYNVEFDEYLMELVNSSKQTSGGGDGGFGELRAADPQAIAYAWQRRLNSYIKSGDIV